ncbi:NAD(P)-dependent oxidoreductase [Chloroflexus islandicus]|uniref:dTDP-4-dehydrorhamnose reductase n=1 Tax=Chloroflexus islandicus TaxID=1707952 RepID=A0A178MAL5_9CHLR|nr:dTDP-4-dehydrorhamnose reductase [Chloroflexus islandicus]OAN45078.1 NAD(P)-dependent oxidoreductase [Chloroflexus islandicus]
MRIAITGAQGQLGQAVIAALADQHDLAPLGHGQLELADPATADQIAATGADVVIHAAAYTNVDGCARDPLLAYRVNGLGTRYVALGCRRINAALVYISTNEVFAGDGRRPYFEDDPTGPINPYGQSKLAGEQAVRALWPRHFIVRVAWLFGGERNFVRTVLRLATNPPAGGLRMVADEIGSPTYAPDVAAGLARLITTDYYGTYHFVNDGICSRYEFAAEILRRAGIDTSLHPIRLRDFQRDSTPPPYTPLANVAGAALGITFRPWQEALDAYLDRLRRQALLP